jgi:hypothetical protein
MSIACGHCKGRHESVSEVRSCSQIAPSSAAEANFRGPSSAPGQAFHDYYRQTNAAERAEESRQARTVKAKTRATEGMYRKSGTIYKVQKAVHGSGQTYAKRLVQTLVADKKTGKPKWKFEYAPGFVFELRPEHALTIEQAKEFGALYGTCCVCGRTLTNEDSIVAGIGRQDRVRRSRALSRRCDHDEVRDRSCHRRIPEVRLGAAEAGPGLGDDPLRHGWHRLLRNVPVNAR